MRKKKIILTICALVTTVIFAVGTAFALDWWYSLDNRNNNQLTFGKPIQAYINGAITNAGNYDTEIQPGTTIPTNTYTIIVADINDPDIHDDLHGGTSSNVTQKYAYNLYLKIREDGNNPNTADTKYWFMSCRTAWVTTPGQLGYVENKTRPYGDNQHTAQRQLPLRQEGHAGLHHPRRWLHLPRLRVPE